MAERDVARWDAQIAHLSQAHQRRELVRVARSIEGSDVSTGYVVGVGSHWVMLSVLDAGTPDGWVALRTHDIAEVTSAPGGRFVQRGLEFQQSWPPRPPAPPVPVSASTRSLLTSAAGGFDLVSVSLEHHDPTSCLIGRPLGYVHGYLSWKQLDAAGVWEAPSTPCRLSAITRVDFGGRYHQALTQVSYLRSLLDQDLDISG